VGLAAADASRRPGVRTVTVPLASVDRAVIDGTTDGFARVDPTRQSLKEEVTGPCPCLNDPPVLRGH
jgi:hypothetical protein